VRVALVSPARLYVARIERRFLLPHKAGLGVAYRAITIVDEARRRATIQGAVDGAQDFVDGHHPVAIDVARALLRRATCGQHHPE
jgi:hypothetical protein